MLSTRDLLAREIRENAYTVAQYEQESWSIQNVRETLLTARWNQYAAEWSALRRKHNLLWNEVADAYDALQRTISHGAHPPSSATLNDLADRLDEANL
jgi:hypothetical protein